MHTHTCMHTRTHTRAGPGGSAKKQAAEIITAARGAAPGSQGWGAAAASKCRTPHDARRAPETERGTAYEQHGAAYAPARNGHDQDNSGAGHVAPAGRERAQPTTTPTPTRTHAHTPQQQAYTHALRRKAGRRDRRADRRRNYSRKAAARENPGCRESHSRQRHTPHGRTARTQPKLRTAWSNKVQHMQTAEPGATEAPARQGAERLLGKRAKPGPAQMMNTQRGEHHCLQATPRLHRDAKSSAKRGRGHPTRERAGEGQAERAHAAGAGTTHTTMPNQSGRN